MGRKYLIVLLVGLGLLIGGTTACVVRTGHHRHGVHKHKHGHGHAYGHRKHKKHKKHK